MVYGKEGVFDAERLIYLLQALEKFVAVKEKGDGSAYKVGGKRGGVEMGTAGDFAGSRCERKTRCRLKEEEGSSCVCVCV
jgi:hypothetical protein